MMSDEEWLENKIINDAIKSARTRGGITLRTRFKILKRDKFRCQYCGLQALTNGVVLCVDHIKPLAKGGINTAENLITACRLCNMGKADTELDD